MPDEGQTFLASGATLLFLSVGLLPVKKYLASLVAQLLKNLPAVQETWVQSLAWDDALEEGMTTHSNILAWRIPMDRGAWWATVHGITQSRTRLSD